jgi:cephalosporin hydroxylase/predicted O-methyltransferase YrrM
MHFPPGDYVSPGFTAIKPDRAFPHLISGTPETCPWPYPQPQVSHNWYGDERWQQVGFLSRDEALILYNTALQFQKQRSLEIGCWLGWSTCHLALAGVEVDAIDPMLERPEVLQSITESLQLAGVASRVNLVSGYSPQAVQSLAALEQQRWPLIVIDGHATAPAPLQDAIACEQVAAADALILFNNLVSPDVAQGLDYLRQRGWQTLIYETMHLMGAAWRGNVSPVVHQPDPTIDWQLPSHLAYYPVSTGEGLVDEIGTEIPDSEIFDETDARSAAQWLTAQRHYTYRGLPCPVHPLDFALYPLMLWDLKPRTVFLLGSQSGGDALWLGDLLLNFAIAGQVYAIGDSPVTDIAHPQVTWKSARAANLEAAFSPEELSHLPHPWLVVEQYGQADATEKILRFLHPYLQPGDRVAIAGTADPAVQTCRYQAVQHFLSKPGYERDRHYCDFFGKNQSSFPGGVLRKVQATPAPPPDPSPPTPTGDSLLEQLIHHIHQARLPGLSPQVPDGDRQQLRQQFHQGQAAYEQGDYAGAIAALNPVVLHSPESVMTHQYLSAAHWHQGNLQASVDHYLAAQIAHTLGTVEEETGGGSQKARDQDQDNTGQSHLLQQVQTHSRLSGAQLRSLHQLARQICQDDIPGDFVQVGSDVGAAALLATVIKRHSQRRRTLYLFLSGTALASDSNEMVQADDEANEEQPTEDALDALCHTLQARGIVIPCTGEFAMPVADSGDVALPEAEEPSGAVALAHLVQPNSLNALKALYFAMAPGGVWQIANYGQNQTWTSLWQQFQRQYQQSFALRWVDDTGVWWRTQTTPEPEAAYAAILWQMAQTATRLGWVTEAEQAVQAVLTLMPRLVVAERWLHQNPERGIDINSAATETATPGQVAETATDNHEATPSEHRPPAATPVSDEPEAPDQFPFPDIDPDLAFEEEEPPTEVKELRAALGIRDLTELEHLVQQFQEEPDPLLVVGQLRRVRQHLAEQCLSMPGDELDWLYPGELGEMHRMIMASGLRDETLTQAEREFRRANLEFLQDGVGAPGGVQHLLAIMLFVYPDELDIPLDITAIPVWLLTDYLWFMGTLPDMVTLSETRRDRVHHHIARWTQYIAEQVAAQQNEEDADREFWHQVAIAFTDLTDFSTIDEHSEDWPELNAQRGAIADFASPPHK